MPFEIYDRISTGQITAVDSVRNICMVKLYEKTDEIEAEIGYPFVSRFSGIRFMPRPGDVCLVGYTPLLVPKVIGFNLAEEQSLENIKSSEDGRIGYRQLEQGDIVLYSGFGETDIFLSSKGYLELGSGVSSLKLDSVRRSIEFVAGMLRGFTLNGANINAGPVLRNIAGVETVIPGAVEFDLFVEGLTGKVADIKLGNVIDDLGIVEVGVTGDKLLSLKAYGAEAAGMGLFGELYIDRGLTISVDGQFIRLGGILAIYSVVYGEPLQALLTNLISGLENLCRAVITGDHVDSATVTAVLAQLGSLKLQIPGLVSPTVKVK